MQDMFTTIVNPATSQLTIMQKKFQVILVKKGLWL